jgi:hypothetical protein
MPNLTLSISNELKEKMDNNKVINWSEVARRAIEKKLNETVSEEERENIDWAVKLQKLGRSGRLEELKKRGLI